MRGLSNVLTNTKGMLDGLNKGGLKDQKVTMEADLRKWIAAKRPAGGPGGSAIEIGVAGMTCEKCVSKLESALRREPGVQTARVLLDPGTAIVHGNVDVERLRHVIESAGYTPK